MRVGSCLRERVEYRSDALDPGSKARTRRSEVADSEASDPERARIHIATLVNRLLEVAVIPQHFSVVLLQPGGRETCSSRDYSVGAAERAVTAILRTIARSG